ncbi:hypothetical protein HML84_04850 [Alcanivorax sp. IO_7]|nr:hypothetical protein HML84_04850 [Alcanivorax sp. IO_7]
MTDIAELVPEYIRKMVNTTEAAIDELIILHAGWSEREGRVIGYAYDKANDFEPIRLDQGHTFVPQPSDQAPGYDRLAELSEKAATGQNMQGFHTALLRNQLWSYQNGYLPAGRAIGDTLSIATVDSEGARLIVDRQRIEDSG